jgi:hypothetical protein
MKLSDLLGSEAFDDAGNPLGKVRDVRVVQDGPVMSPFGASLRIEGLVVGQGALGERLGFHRSTVKGPWLLKTLFELRHRDARFVPWDAIAVVGEGRIDVARAAEALPRVDKL